MDTIKLTADLTVAVVLEQWPETVPVFQEFKTACVGCALASFDTLKDVARIYQLDLNQLMSAVQATIEKTVG